MDEDDADDDEAMRALGVPDKYIEGETESGDEDQDESRFFRVWPENWEATQVFLRCSSSFDMVAGFNGIYYLGIKNSEIEIVMRLMKIPEDKQLSMLDDVSYMADVAAREKNRD